MFVLADDCAQRILGTLPLVMKGLRIQVLREARPGFTLTADGEALYKELRQQVLAWIARQVAALSNAERKSMMTGLEALAPVFVTDTSKGGECHP